MGLSSEELLSARLCWASWLLGFLSLLAGVCSTGATSSGAHVSKNPESGVVLRESRGGSVLFPVSVESQAQQDAELEEMTWSVGPESKQKIMFQVHRGSDQPSWHGLEAKYKHRVHMPNRTSLRIDNLTLEDSGQYNADVRFTGGTISTQKFHLIVYEPVPFPQIGKKSSSLTADWCNVTLECSVPGPAEQNLSMTCKSKDLPTNLHQSIPSGPGTNSWTFTVHVALSQPQSQPNGSIACVVSNSEDEKTVTFDLKDTCVHGQTDNRLLGISLGISVFLLMTLGAGLFFWNTHWKKEKEKEEETRRGPGLQTDCRDDDGDPNNVEVSHQEALTGRNKLSPGEGAILDTSRILPYPDVPNPRICSFCPHSLFFFF